MNYKKTWFGWINFFIGTGFMSVFLFALLASMLKNTGLTLSFLNFDEKITSVCLAVVLVLFAFGIFYLMNFCKKNISIVPSKGTKIVKNILYTLFVVALIILLVILSVNYLDGVYLERTRVELGASCKALTDALFKSEKVSSDNYPALIYAYIVSFVYRLFGNNIFYAACLEVFLKGCISVFLFVSATLLFGRVQGLFGFGFLLLFCDITRPAEFLCEEPLVCFVSSFFIMVFAMVLRDRNEGEMKTLGNSIFFIFFGAVFGILTYFDIKNLFAFVLFVFVLLLSRTEKAEKRLINRPLIPLLFFVLFFAAGFLGTVLLVDCGLNIDALTATLMDYLNHFDFVPDFSFAYPSYYPAECVVIAVFCLFSFLSYTVSGKKDRITVYAFGFLVLYFAYVFKSVDTDLAHLLYLFFGIMMGSGVYEFLFTGYDDGEDSEENELINESEHIVVKEYEPVLVQEPEPVIEQEQEPVIEQEQEPVVVELFENPLPLPKKHVKKSFDFSIEPADEFMEFDYEISEDDDFDI